MDFFAAQDQARARTRRLVFLFTLAVLAIIASTSAAVFLILEFDRFAAEGPTVDAALSTVVAEHLDVFALIAVVTLAMVSLAALYKWLQVRAGGHAVAEMLGGVRVDPSTTDPFERRLVNVVEEMAIASGIPIPEVYVLPHEPAINAFAAGLTTSDAVIAVTRGCLEKLSRDELQGVVAHEFGHVLNGDMRLNVQLIALLHGILFIAILGRVVLRMVVHSGGRARRSDKNGGGLVLLVAAGVLLVVMGYAGYFFGRLIQAAVSRQREYLADASAVQFTRNPAGIAGALKKIGGYSFGSKMVSPQSSEVSHALFAQGFRSGLVGLLATHPPLEARIRAIDPTWEGAYLEAPEHEVALREARATEARHAGVVSQLAASGAAPSAASVAAASSGAAAFSPERAMAEVGNLTEDHVHRAQELRAAIPEVLLEAAHDAHKAPALVYGLLLARDDARTRDGQLALLARDPTFTGAAIVRALVPALAQLHEGHRLPLVQIALPSLHALKGGELDAFFRRVHELVHFDGHVDAFEFALQKLLVHHLRLAADPTRAAVRRATLAEVTERIAALLSFLAHRVGGPEGADHAFAAGASRLPTIADRLRLLPPKEGYDAIHDALEVLEHAPLEVRRLVLDAAAHVVGAGHAQSVEEIDLLRVVASVLDCPMPLL